MKCRICLFATLLMAALTMEAAPMRYRPATPPRKPLTERVTWKHIAAGGAAAGTLVAAYKVSNGIEDGIRTAAQKDPAGFTSWFSSLFAPVRWFLILCVIYAGYCIWRSITKKAT